MPVVPPVPKAPSLLEAALPSSLAPPCPVVPPSLAGVPPAPEIAPLRAEVHPGAASVTPTRTMPNPRKSERDGFMRDGIETHFVSGVNVLDGADCCQVVKVWRNNPRNSVAARLDPAPPRSFSHT